MIETQSIPTASKLTIVLYPDPRLKRVAQEVTQFDDSLKDLAARMLELMHQARGVGLAAPQVGVLLRLFVMNHTGKPEDDRVYVNPVLSDPNGSDEDEEGCLSLPDINTKVLRSQAVRIDANDVNGQPISQTESGYLARIWQHETDHLNGVLLIDHMGPVAKLANRKKLRELEQKYAAARGPKKRIG